MPKDKMPLGDYVESIASQIATAFEKFEKDHPGWEVGVADIVARGVLKPVEKDGVTTVWIDLDEPANMPRSDIPIKIRRTDRIVKKADEDETEGD